MEFPSTRGTSPWLPFRPTPRLTPLRQRMQHDMLMRGFGSAHPAGLRPPRPALRHLPGAPARHRNGRGYPAFPVIPARERRRPGYDQRRGLGAALPVHGDAEAAGPGAGLVIIRHPRKLPEVLSVEEAARLLDAAPGLKYKAALGVAYGAGLRVSEVAHLKVDDIDCTRMLIRIEQGKGRKDRNAMLSPQLLELLRLWWREGKRRGVMLPHGWLFPGRSCTDPISHAAAAPRRAGSGRGRRHPQARQPAHAAPQLRHPPAGAGRRYPRHPGAAGARQARDHRASTPRSRPRRSMRSPARSTGCWR